MQAGADAPLPPPAMLVLPAELTHRQARAALQALHQGVLALPPGARAVVDARALTQFDTSALAVLLECRRTAKVWPLRWPAWPCCTACKTCCPPPTDSPVLPWP